MSKGSGYPWWVVLIVLDDGNLEITNNRRERELGAALLATRHLSPDDPQERFSRTSERGRLVVRVA